MLQPMWEALPTGAVLAGGKIECPVDGLLAEEHSYTRTMSALRRREFAAGRHYARDALRALGVKAVAIPVQSTRDPAWPAGIVGAISHNREHCAAVVARGSMLAAIGLDIESADPLPEELVTLVCRPADCRDRAALERAIGVDLPKLVFVLKEAFYKAYFPTTKSFLEFKDVEIALDPAGSRFEARLVAPSRPACFGRRTIGGRFGRTRNTLFGVAWVTALKRSA